MNDDDELDPYWADNEHCLREIERLRADNERLQEELGYVTDEWNIASKAESRCHELRAEIERLKATLKVADAEIERLQALVAATEVTCRELREFDLAEIERLERHIKDLRELREFDRKKIERLQAALRKVADLVDSEADEPLDDAIAIARRALEQKL